MVTAIAPKPQPQSGNSRRRSSLQLLGAQHPPAFAYLPRWSFIGCWLILLLLHLVVVLYVIGIAGAFLILPGTYLDQALQYMSLGLGTRNHQTIAGAFLIAGIPHIYSFGAMIWRSCRRRRLVLRLDDRLRTRTSMRESSRVLSAATMTNNGWAQRLESITVIRHFLCPMLRATRRGAAWLFETLLSRRGLFGVDRPYYHSLMLTREAIETGLQTYQAYQMSFSISRPWLNRGFVGLLVLNCWTHALVHHANRHNEIRGRLLCLVLDAVLDFVCSVALPCIVFVWYVDIFNPSEELWQDDVFIVSVMTDLRTFVVSSWWDLANRVWFLVGLSSAMSSIKSLLRLKPSISVGLAPDLSRSPTVTDLIEKKHNPQQHTAKSWHLVAFFLWGLVIVILQVHSEMATPVPNCLLQPRPWAVSSPACAVVNIRCDRLLVNGSRADLEQIFATLEAPVVLRVVVRHCSRLDISPHIRNFGQLTGVKLYNSTIERWDVDAGLTADAHPRLKFLQLIRVQFPHGRLPPGLTSRPFPPKLNEIQLSITNLAELPDDLDTIWNKGTAIFLELGALTVYPESLVRLSPVDVGVDGNPIAEIPAEALENPNLRYISLGHTNVTRLPADVRAISPSLEFIELSDTGVEWFEAWVDPFLRRTLDETGPVYRIFASGTPYCRQLEQLRAGERSELDATTTSLPLSALLMSVRGDWDLAMLEKVVLCGSFRNWFYSWDIEDARFGLSQPGIAGR